MSPAGNPPPTRLTYIPALDGMRGISLPGTIFTHYAILLQGLPSAPRWLGNAAPFTLNIEMFFTLSGALITSLLVSEFRRTGGVSLKRFYLRRSRRLGPALFFTIPVLLLATPFLTHSRSVQPLGPHPWLAALVLMLFLGNWLLATDNDMLGWMGPAWTLGIEEQFYLTWPLLLVQAMRHGWSRARILLALTVVIGLCIGFAAWALPRYGWLATGYLTPTQIPSILVGCALGYVLTTTPEGRLAGSLKHWSAALAGLAGMAVISWQWHDEPGLLDQGGFIVYALFACLVIGHCMVRAAEPSWVNHVLGWKPFVIIGQLSYEAYLIHVLVILAVLRAFPTMDVTQMVVLDSVLIAAISAAFYYGVAAPIRRFGWVAGLNRRRPEEDRTTPIESAPVA